MVKTYRHLYPKLYSFENMYDAYRKAKKNKGGSRAVKKFDEHWRLNLCLLILELRSYKYQPKPLQKFVLRDPKTRVICVSDFRDRIVHHALVNILQPIFEPRFIYDSYASRKGKGTLAALKRLDSFMRKVTSNGKTALLVRNANDVRGFALKADIKHYFQTVDQQTLLAIINKKIDDEGVMWLTQTILNHYHSGILGKGMPLGNWTSQFFANVYLNELDQFVKHTLKAQYYLRYVDDFILMHSSLMALQRYQRRIDTFLKTISLELHPQKSTISPLSQGISFVGFKVFYHYKLVRSRNKRKIRNYLAELLDHYERNEVDAVYLFKVLSGWKGYARHGNSFRFYERLLTRLEQELESRTAANQFQLESSPPSII